MSKIKFGSGFAIFLLFFGVAIVQAVRNLDWLWIILWIAIGLVFFWADNRGSGKNT